MKKLCVAFLTLVFFGCSDGDIAVEIVDFDLVSIQTCPGNNSLLFKINDAEALILNVPDGFIKEDVESLGEETVTIANQAQFFYRFFSENVTATFFCSELTPATPTIADEIPATDGLVILNAAQFVENNANIFVNTINIEDLVLINDSGERIIDSDFKFGDVIIPDGQGTIFNMDNLQACPLDPSLLFNINGNKAIVIDLPDGVILNEESALEGIPVSIPDEASITYTIFAEDIPADFFCIDPMPTTPEIVTQSTATGGTITVVTRESTTSPGTFNHTITVEGLVLLNGREMPVIGINGINLGTTTTSN